MKALFFLLLVALLTGCASAFEHSAQAPRRARHSYHHQQRQHAHERRHTSHSLLLWN